MRRVSLSLVGILAFSVILNAQLSARVQSDTIRNDSFICLIERIQLFENDIQLTERGIVKCHDRNDRLIWSYSTDLAGDTDGTFLSYYMNGMIREYRMYNKGMRCGDYYELYDNGNIKCMGQYTPCKDDIVMRCDSLVQMNPATLAREVTIRCRPISKPVGTWLFVSIIGEIYTRDFGAVSTKKNLNR